MNLIQGAAVATTDANDDLSYQGLANVAVCGKFHFFNYINILRKSRRLHRFYYSHRSFPEPGPCAEYCRLPLKEYLIQGHLRLLGDNFFEILSPVYSDLWNRAVLKRWQPMPLLHFVANGNCLPVASRAKEDGSRLIAEVVVVHPEYLSQIIKEEAERWRVRGRELIPLKLQRRHKDELALADVILAPSNFVAKTYRQKNIVTKINVSPYAANIQRFRPRSHQSSAEGPLRVLSVGQIGLRKGQLYLLEAVKRFTRREIELTLVGTVSPELRERVSEYEGSFTHVNRIANIELAEMHQKFDIFVLPSLAEGLAVSICEAMGSGLTVACTAESGGTEIIEDGQTGYIIAARSVEAIESFLSFCLRNRDEMRRVGQNAAKAVRDRVNWDIYVERLVRLYDEVVDRQYSTHRSVAV